MKCSMCNGTGIITPDFPFIFNPCPKCRGKKEIKTRYRMFLVAKPNQIMTEWQLQQKMALKVPHHLPCEVMTTEQGTFIAYKV